MLVEMKVASLSVDPFTNLPTLVLRDRQGRSVPVWIGQGEAPAIAAELENVRLDRPMTHDLLKTILGLYAIQVERAEINDLRGGSFFATLHLRQPGGTPLAVDARPSDAIAQALRARAPIFVAERVIEKLRRQARPHSETRPLFTGFSDKTQKAPKWKM